MHYVTRISLLALTGVAFVNTNALADGGEENPELAESAATSELAPSVWPLAMRDRPLTLAKGMFSAGASVDMSSTFDNIRLGLGGLTGLSYGISDDLTAGVSYDLGISPGEEKGPIALHAAYTAYAEGALILTVTTTVTRNLLSESNLVNAGLMYWYNLGEKLSIYGGGDQLGLQLDPSQVSMSLPVAVGYQLNDNSFLAVDTNLADLVIHDETDMAASTFIGADTLPLGVSATYSPSNSLDLFAGVSTDLKNAPADALTFGLGAIYYGGTN